MKYFVTVGGREFAVEIDGERVVVDGVASMVHREGIPGTPLGLLRIDDRPAVFTLETPARGQWVVGAGGSRHEAAVMDERERHLASLIGAGSRSSGAGTLRAPMPGLVTRVAVAVGDAVRPGQGLVVLEAMKMENELKAAGAGVVRAVLVAAGAAVEKGQVLVELGEAADS
ncbi:MAG: biotin/lipoyl-binding protein [Gemmatimonadales bacterium]|jgi:pyruvate carboxylase subunit B|nr:biotin/lipoyl-binding protein [Gemmatimonadales bacterium]